MAARTQVRMRTRYSSVSGVTCAPGSCLMVGCDEAKSLVNGGFAEFVPEEAPKGKKGKGAPKPAAEKAEKPNG